MRIRISETGRVRLDDLFDDLAGQFDAEFERERQRQAVEDERLRIARATLRIRLLALEATMAPGESLSLEMRGGERLAVEPVEFGADWFAAKLAAPARRYVSVLVPLQGIGALLLTRQQIEGSLTEHRGRTESLANRLGFAIPLRDLARRRVHCEITTATELVQGTIDRVGRDHLDLAVHEGDTTRHGQNVAVYRVIPLADVRLVRVRGEAG